MLKIVAAFQAVDLGLHPRPGDSVDVVQVYLFRRDLVRNPSIIKNPWNSFQYK